MENEKYFIEGSIKKETEKAYMVDVSDSGHGIKSMWLPKSRSEIGSVQPANDTPKREGIWTEDWLIEKNLKEKASYLGRQITISIWNEAGECGMMVG